MKLHRLLAPALAWVALASCAQTPPAVAEPESARRGRELRELVGTAACSTDAQCRSLPVGAKACGGPAGYLAWSTQGTDAARLQTLATKQADAQRRENEASGMLSNCALVADPGAACMAGRCQLARPAATSAR